VLEKDLSKYLDSRNAFKLYIKAKVEGKCHVNNKGWVKLVEYHLDGYLSDIENPFAFLYNIKHFHRSVYYSTPSMRRHFYKHKSYRDKYWDEI